MAFDEAVYPRNPFQQFCSSYPLGYMPRTLTEAIDVNSSIDFIRDLIKKNPECIFEKGFSGLRPLHKAVLLGNQRVVELLLHHSADVNCQNDFMETPLLLACRQGFLNIVHHLILHGADMNATDKIGRGVLQFAAQGGSVMVLHYLSTVHGLSLGCRDGQGNSLLHITASQGHNDAAMYLLRKQRNDVFTTNNGGYTALHCSAQIGYEWLSWMFLETGGTKLLSIPTNEGYTATKLAQKGLNNRQQEVYTLLNQFEQSVNSKQLYRKMLGPVILWYWKLVVPLVLYLTVLSLSVNVNGYLMFPGMILILVVCAQQGHRIKHISRLANPVYCGMFAAGLLMTSLCYLVVVMPTVSQSHHLLTYSSLVWLLLMTVCYLYLLKLDPGVQSRAHCKESGEDYTVLDIAKGIIPLSSFCTACEFVQKPQTKHCKLCQKCHTGMDHHCLFLYKCIAHNNHRQFVHFIMIVIISMVLFEYQAVLHLMVVYPGLREAATDFYLQILREQPWLFSTMLANGLSLLWGMLLLRFQLKFISQANTQYFQSHTSQSHLSAYHRLRNIINFMLGRKYYAKNTDTGVLLL